MMMAKELGTAVRSRILHVPSRHLASSSTFGSVNLPYKSNKDQFPKFTPKDNSSGKADMEKHNKETWPIEDINAALKKSSVFTWGASDALRDGCIHVDRAEGVYLFDRQGRKYLDWSAGAVCTNLGHTVPASIRKAAAVQLARVPFVYGDLCTHDPRARLSALLAEIAPGDINSFMFACSGAEANECAIRMARRYTGRQKIMSRHRSYHGGTSAPLAMTGDNRRWFVDTSTAGFVKMMEPFPLQFEWDKDEATAVRRSLDALHDQIICENPASIAAIVLEPVTGANGWLKPSTAYMQGVRALCDEYGILLVFDEVMTGFGRCGEMFGTQLFEGVQPDMITFAKGVTSAYAPLSGVGIRDHVFEFFRKNPLGYGLTYNSHPLTCAMGYETVKYIIENDIVGHVRKMEGVMAEGLSRLVESHPCVKQARVYGLGAGFDLMDKNGNFLLMGHQTNEGLNMFKKKALEEGLITLYRGHHVHCTPPLIINEEEIREGIDKLDRALNHLDDWILKN